MKPVFKVDDVDFSWILMEEGIQWSRNDIDTEATKRSPVSAEMYRKRLAIKRKLTIPRCKRMTTAQIKALNAALLPETIKVTILDPMEGDYRDAVFYGSSVQATTQIYDAASDETYWVNTTFSLTEV